MNSSNEPYQTNECRFQYNSLPEWRPSFLTSEMTAILMSITVINLLVPPFTVFLNILTIIAITTTHRLRTNCNVLLASLAGTDFITGALGQPLFVAEQLYRLTDSMSSQSFCFLKHATSVCTNISVIASLEHLALLSIERYIAIKYPYRYDDVVNKRRLIIAIILAWLLPAFATAFYTVNNAFTSFFRTIIVLVSILVLIFCHCAVYQEARKQMRKIKMQQVCMEAKQTFLKEKKALNTTTIVIGVVLFSFVPLISLRLVLVSFLTSPVMSLAIETAFRSLPLCNSLCNPLIYCARNSEFRRSFKKLLLKQTRVQPA